VFLIPLTDFFRNPERTNYTLSPDGEFFAFMMPWKQRLNVYVQKIGEDDFVRVTSETDRDVAEYSWANNYRLVYIKDERGDENFKLHAVDKDGANGRILTPGEKITVQIIDKLEDNDEEMIIAINNRDASIFDVYRINIISGEKELISENPGNITGWLTDHDGKLRVAVTTDGINSSILYRKAKKL